MIKNTIISSIEYPTVQNIYFISSSFSIQNPIPATLIQSLIAILQ